MVRPLVSLGILAAALIAASSFAAAQSDESASAKVVKKKVAAKGKEATDEAAPVKKPLRVGTYGDWGAYQTQSGKNRVCYALAKPKDRQPAKLERDPAFIFISTRPGDGVHNEISVTMGFPLKDGPVDGGADIGGTKFDLVAKGANAWIRNAGDEAPVIEAMRHGSRLLVKVPSKRGNVTTDMYSLAGLSQALDKVSKLCP